MITKRFMPGTLLLLGTLGIVVAAASHQEKVVSENLPTAEGTVIDAATLQPLQDVQVVLAVGNSTIQQTTVNASGAFRIAGIPLGSYTLVPRKTGYVFLSESTGASRQSGLTIHVTSNTRRIDGVVLNMVKTGVITGRVTDARGTPIVSAKVRLRQRVYDMLGTLRLVTEPNLAQTNDRGEYRIVDVTPGEYFVVTDRVPLAFRDGILAVSTYFPGTIDVARASSIRVTAGEEVRVTDFVEVQTEGMPVTLRLPDIDRTPGSIGPVFNLHIRDLNANIQLGTGKDSGVLVLPAVAPGRLEGVVSWLTTNGQASSPFVIDVGSNLVDVELKPTGASRLSIGIVQRESGKVIPAKGVACAVFPTVVRNSLTMRCADPSATVLQIPNGTYDIELQGIGPDRHVAEVIGPAGKLPLDNISVQGDLHIQVLLARGGGRINGVARDKGGQLMPNAVVVLVPDLPLRRFGYLYRTGSTDMNGVFELGGIEPGNYRVFAWRRLNGAAYRNEDFMKEQIGQPVVMRSDEKVTVDLVVVAE